MCRTLGCHCPPWNSCASPCAGTTFSEQVSDSHMMQGRPKLFFSHCRSHCIWPARQVLPHKFATLHLWWLTLLLFFFQTFFCRPFLLITASLGIIFVLLLVLLFVLLLALLLVLLLVLLQVLLLVHVLHIMLDVKE